MVRLRRKHESWLAQGFSGSCVEHAGVSCKRPAGSKRMKTATGETGLGQLGKGEGGNRRATNLYLSRRKVDFRVLTRVSSSPGPSVAIATHPWRR